MPTTIYSRRPDAWQERLSRGYKLNAAWCFMAALFVLVGLRFYFEPAAFSQAAVSRIGVKPLDYAVFSFYVAGGLLLIYGLLDWQPKAQLAGIGILLVSLTLFAISALVVVGQGALGALVYYVLAAHVLRTRYKLLTQRPEL